MIQMRTHVRARHHFAAPADEAFISKILTHEGMPELALYF
jgi:hypothetical protein